MKKRFPVFLLSLLSVSLLQLSAAEPGATAVPEKKAFHLYLLLGQSNMAGRGVLDQESKVPHARVLTLDQNNQWVPATDPLHFQPKDAVGPGFSFGKAMAEKDPSVTIGLIPCAVGGSPLSRWVKGGPLYLAAVARAQEAMKSGELKGILWHQGESDSKKDEHASTYADRLTRMIEDLRTELGQPDLPFVGGELGPFLLETNLPYWKKVNESLVTTLKKLPHCGVVSAEGLIDKGDNLHFDTTSERELGRRYAAEMSRLSATP